MLLCERRRGATALLGASDVEGTGTSSAMVVGSLVSTDNGSGVVGIAGYTCCGQLGSAVVGRSGVVSSPLFSVTGRC